ncbi:RelA/SpoT domain-containing protein [Bacillus subtilis]|nr:RelA/SpoT domain-containing protein [Bacillus subtilis]
MAWVTQEFSKNQVKKAGRLIGRGGSPAELAEARAKISNFRSAHAYPLYAVTMHVRKNALALSPVAIVARRLKRLPTIIDKLTRHPQMNVTTMQDLGGCRVIFQTVTDVDALVNRLSNTTRAKNVIIRSCDYLRDAPGPQSTGYRGVHLVYEYRASKTEFQGSVVEVQIRTELQHAWATAVETLDLFGGTRLKYGTGSDNLKRYFLIVSALMAIREGLPQPTAASGNADSLRDELRALEKDLGVLSRLNGYAAIVKQFGSEKQTIFLMQLNRSQQTLYLTICRSAVEAEAKLQEVEDEGDDNIDAVLVSGYVNQKWPHHDGFIWPQPRHLAVSGQAHSRGVPEFEGLQCGRDDLAPPGESQKKHVTDLQ